MTSYPKDPQDFFFFILKPWVNSGLPCESQTFPHSFNILISCASDNGFCKLSKVRNTSVPRAWPLLVIQKTSVLIPGVGCICTLLSHLKGISELNICTVPF